MFRRIINYATFGRFTSGPAALPKVRGSVGVGVRGKAARAARKAILTGAVALLGMAADGTLSAAVARIDRDQRYAGEFRLVLQKQPELRERPRVQNCTLLSPGLDPFADAVEVFNGDTTTGAFSFSNDLLGDIVIDPGRKAPLLAGEFLQSALRRPGLFLLELRPQPSMPVTDVLDLRAGVTSAIAIRRDVGDTQIDPQEISGIDRSAFGEIDCAVQVELSLAKDQIALALNSVESAGLIFAIDQGNDDAAFGYGPKADTIEALEAHDALVVGDGSVWFKDRAFGFIAGETLDRLADGSDGHLCGELEPLADFSVGEFMDRRLTIDFRIKSQLGRERRGLVNVLHSFEEPFLLLGIGQQPQLECELHCLGVYRSVPLKVNRLKGSGLNHGGLR